MKKNMNRVTVICLGVIDMKKSLQFYRDKLGFKTDETGDNPDVVFFSTPGTKLELYPLDLLAKDIDPGNPPAPGSGFRGITLAYNAITKEEGTQHKPGSQYDAPQWIDDAARACAADRFDRGRNRHHHQRTSGDGLH